MPLGDPVERSRVYSEQEILDEICMAEEKQKAVRKQESGAIELPATKASASRPPPPSVRPPYILVVFTCLTLGAICVGSSVFKTWFGTPTSYDWLILGMGVVLCGLSLFRRVSLGATGFDAEIEAIREQIRTLTALKSD